MTNAINLIFGKKVLALPVCSRLSLALLSYRPLAYCSIIHAYLRLVVAVTASPILHLSFVSLLV
jgi:hypothetical protein